MIYEQLKELRYIIQEEIENAINTKEAGYSSLREEERLDKLWHKFKNSFNGLN
jgi:hypothetical protein